MLPEFCGEHGNQPGHPADSTSACSIAVLVADSCLSGG